MSDTSRPTWLSRRGKSTPNTDGEQEVDPEVVALFSKIKREVRDTGEANKILTEENNRLRLDRDRDQGRINLLQSELNKEKRQGRGYQRAYSEQKAEIAVLITAAETARAQSLAAIKSALHQAEAATQTALHNAEAAVNTAFEGFVQTSNACLKAIKEALVEEGIDPVEPNMAGEPILKDEDLRAIGYKYGADGRLAEERKPEGQPEEPK